MDGLRFVVSDVLWRRLEPYFPGKTSDCGVTAKDNRLFLDAVFWRVRTGSPWVALARFAPAFGIGTASSGGFAADPRPKAPRL